MTLKKNLGYFWKAEFDDDHVIEQFDGETEIRFREVLDYSGTLTKFSVISVDNPKEIFVADLSGKNITTPNSVYLLKGLKPSLIYKRRNQVRGKTGTGEIMTPRVTHILGIKTSTQEKQLEIFKSVGMVPKKIELVNLKTKVRENLTDTIKSELDKLAIIR